LLGVVFSLLYAAPQLARPGHAHSGIPIEPKVSQLEAIEIIERDLYAKIPEIKEIRLAYFLYNFSEAEYESDSEYIDYRHKRGFYAWPFSHIKQWPELLQMPLMFVHANGTTYEIDESVKTFEKVCDEPSPICPMGRNHTIAAKDRLVYRAGITWEPTIEELGWHNEGYYVIDAESGEIVWNSIDYERNRKPMPSVNFDNKTIAQLFRERLDPPETAYVSIERGASNEDNKIGYLPKEIRTTLSIDNKIVWTNTDSVAHTVVSDNDYASQYTGNFESEAIAPNSTFYYTFFDAGYYPYRCEIHPHMKGAVEVIENFT
jgi:plastocyanin